MASFQSTDGILGHLMNLKPQSFGRNMPGMGSGEASSLAETEAFGPNPGNLRMLSNVPEGLGGDAPLVVVLHGCGQTAAEYDSGAGWSTLADRFGFALLLPEQRRANNSQGCFDWFQSEDITRGAGEVASIAAMIGTMIEKHGLDRRRVFVTGLSAGGAMTAALLATYPDLFAGGAIIAGLPFGSASTVPEAFGVMGQGRIRSPRELGDRVRGASAYRGDWPTVSIWQGSADTTVNPVNAEELRKQWADVHGVTDARAEESVVDGARHRAWRSPGGRVVLETYVINGLGHATPIDPEAAEEDAQCGTGSASRFIVPAGISSSYRIAESWGLIGHRRATARPAEQPAKAAPRDDGPLLGKGAPRRDAPPPHMPIWQDLLPGGKGGMQDVMGRLGEPAALVGKVLRSAGLMGGGKKP
ncbi:MAG: PHB depolymerase family esterase [Proteobacteria bacterium]|nr:PHB depolymerase family esterase [Pseudomonadota bacterium]